MLPIPPFLITPAAPYNFFVGLNASGLEDGTAIPGVPGIDYGIPSNREFDYYNSKNLNFIRLPFMWERMQATLSGPLSSAYLTLVENIVNYAASKYMTVLLDCHNFGRYNNIPIGAIGGPTNADFANLWTQLATVFAGNPGVAGYDIMNEPNNMPSPSTWPSAAQAAINAIRTVDTRTAIYVEGDLFSSAFQWLQLNTNLYQLTDPNKNLIFSAHFYYDSNNSGTGDIWAQQVAIGDLLTTPTSPLTTNIGVKRVSVFAQWCLKYGVRGHVGESGVPNNDNNWLIALNNALSYCQSVGMRLTYWNAGPFSIGYPLGVEPTTTPIGYEDTTQMAVISQYTGSAQPTIYFLGGPQRGAVSVPSTNFTITYRGLIASTITFTMSDSGQGGTFTPATVTMAPGYNGVATFTYTPVGTATYSISTTNDGGLTDPPAVGYATATDLFVNATATPMNIFALSRMYAPYVGPLITLRRSSDNATMSFYALMNGDLDTTSISTWAGASTMFLVEWFDQSPNAAHATTPSGGTIADQPQFFLTGGANNLPYIKWTTNRMNATSPINGDTAQSVLMVAQPTSAVSSFICEWVLNNFNYLPNAGALSMDGELPVNWNLDPTAWHTYFSRYQCNQVNGIQAFVDGEVLDQDISYQASMSFPLSTTMDLGYYRFASAYYAGNSQQLIVFNGALSDANLAAFESFYQSYYNTPAPTIAPTTNLTLGTTGAVTQALSWTAASGASTYTAQYRPHGTTGLTYWLTAQTGISGTSVTLSNLFSQEQQDFRVFGVNGTSVGGVSNAVTATTGVQSTGPNATIPLIGVNLSGLENSSPRWPIPALVSAFDPSGFAQFQSNVQYFTGKGCNVFRLCLSWDNSQKTLNATLDATYMGVVDQCVNYITGLGASVVLDCHCYGKYLYGNTVVQTVGAISSGATTFPVTSVAGLTLGTKVICTGVANTNVPNQTTIAAINSGTNTITLSQGTIAPIPSGRNVTFSALVGVTDTLSNIGVTNANFDDYWTKMATRYLSNPLVIFGTMNEPGQSSVAGLVATMQSATTAIRATGATQMILIQCFNDKGYPGGGIGQAIASGYSDPGSNFAIELHQYFDPGQAGVGPTVISATYGAEVIEAVFVWARVAGYKVWYGEFGSGTLDLSVQCLNNVAAYLSENADVIAGVTMWGAGGFPSSLRISPAGYPLGIEPFNGIDAPQLLTLLQNAPGGGYYGYKANTFVFPLTLVGASFSPATSGWGQALTGGYGKMVNPGNNGIGPLIQLTIEGRVSLNSGATLSGNTYFFNSTNIMGVGVNSSGQLIATTASTVGQILTTTSIQDSTVHHIRYCTDGTTTYLFLDGVLLTSVAGAIVSLASALTGLAAFIGTQNGSSAIWNGSIEYIAMFGSCLSTTNFTPPAAPLAGGIPNMLFLYNLDGNGIGIV